MDDGGRVVSDATDNGPRRGRARFVWPAALLAVVGGVFTLWCGQIENEHVSVVVVGRDAKPVPGAAITVETAPVPPRVAAVSPQTLAQGETGADGVCALEFSLPPRTAARFVAKHGGLLAEGVRTRPSGAPMVMVLQPAGTLDIRVLDARGVPVPGLMVVTAHPELAGDGEVRDAREMLGETDARGVFTLRSGQPWMTRIVPREGRRTSTVGLQGLAPHRPLTVDCGDLRGDVVLQLLPHCAMQIEVAGLSGLGAVGEPYLGVSTKGRFETAVVQPLDAEQRAFVGHVAPGLELEMLLFWNVPPIKFAPVAGPTQLFTTEVIRVSVRPQPVLRLKVLGAEPRGWVEVVLRAGDRESSVSAQLAGDHVLPVFVPDHLEGASLDAVELRSGGAAGRARMEAPVVLVPGVHDLGLVQLASAAVAPRVGTPRSVTKQPPVPDSTVLLALHDVDPAVVPALRLTLTCAAAADADDPDPDPPLAWSAREVHVAGERTLACVWTGIPVGDHRLQIDCVGRGTVAVLDCHVPRDGGVHWLEHSLDAGLRAVQIALLPPIGDRFESRYRREVRVRNGDSWSRASVVDDKATVCCRDGIEGTVRVAGYRDEPFALTTCADIGPIPMRPGIPVEIRVPDESARRADLHFALRDLADDRDWVVNLSSSEPGVFVGVLPAPGMYRVECRGADLEFETPVPGTIEVTAEGGEFECRLPK